MYSGLEDWGMHRVNNLMFITETDKRLHNIKWHKYSIYCIALNYTFVPNKLVDEWIFLLLPPLDISL